MKGSDSGGADGFSFPDGLMNIFLFFGLPAPADQMIEISQFKEGIP
jgi:hypothetical protein